jgi:predicted transcriptional regulator
MDTPSGGSEFVVAARVSHNLRDLIDEIAAKTGATRSEYIRHALNMVVTAERACEVVNG